MDAHRVSREFGALRGPLSAHDLYRRVRALGYARLAGYELPAVGRRARIDPTVRFEGTRRVWLGEGVVISELARLTTVGSGEIRLGDQVWTGPNTVLTSSTELIIEDEVLLAGNCFLSTHRHRFDGEGPVRRQGITAGAPIVVGEGAWLGANVLVLPGVRIGRGAVVGGNSVVRDDVPDFHIAAGAPARLVGPTRRPVENGVVSRSAPSGLPAPRRPEPDRQGALS